MEVILIHYSYPPVIGGVESILRQHAALFSRHGHDVTVLAGSGEPDAGARVEIVPELAPSHPLRAAMDAELAAGAPGPAFASLQRQLATFFAVRLAAADAVFVHNVLTMPFQLAATAALSAWAASRPRPRIVQWIHDLAVLNPDYAFAHPDVFPWNLLRQPPAGVRHVAVSGLRCRQFEELTGFAGCTVVPNGIDAAETLALTPPVAALAARSGWPGRWPVLFHPTRLLRRKNVELGIDVTAALRDAGERPLYIVTAASDPHHAPSRAYAASLRQRVRELQLEDDVVLAQEHFPVGDADVAAFYRMADALFFPSRQEGFGLPLVEAAVNRLPVFASRIEPLTDLGDAHWFVPDAPAVEIAALVRSTLGNDTPHMARRAALARFHWEMLYPRFLAPLLDGAPVG